MSTINAESIRPSSLMNTNPPFPTSRFLRAGDNSGVQRVQASGLRITATNNGYPRGDATSQTRGAKRAATNKCSKRTPKAPFLKEPPRPSPRRWLRSKVASAALKNPHVWRTVMGVCSGILPLLSRLSPSERLPLEWAGGSAQITGMALNAQATVTCALPPQQCDPI